MKTRELESKAWYRAVKVVSLFVVGLSLLITVFLAWSSFPKRTIDNELSRIECTNGNFYALADNKIYAFGDSLDTYDDEHARILCAYDRTDYYSSQFINARIAQNYTFHPVFVEPDYKSWMQLVIMSLLIQGVIFFALRAAFLYVVTGEKPKY